MLPPLLSFASTLFPLPFTSSSSHHFHSLQVTTSIYFKLYPTGTSTISIYLHQHATEGLPEPPHRTQSRPATGPNKAHPSAREKEDRHTAPRTAPYTAPHTAPYSAPYTALHTAPHAAPNSAPYSAPHTAPHCTPRLPSVACLSSPSYNTHFLQPLDASVFGPLKHAYSDLLQAQYAKGEREFGRATSTSSLTAHKKRPVWVPIFSLGFVILDFGLWASALWRGV